MMYSLAKDDSMETSGNRGQKNLQNLNPDHILVEIDHLEARVKDSRRLLQQEHDSVLQLSKLEMTTQDSVSRVVNCISLKASPSSHSSHISSAVSSVISAGSHASVISSSGEAVSANISLFSLSSPFLCNLLSSVPCCTTPVILLPDFSTDGLKHLINVITNGFTSSHLGNTIFKDINEVMDMAKLLNIPIADLSYEETRGKGNETPGAIVEIKMELSEGDEQQIPVLEGTMDLENRDENVKMSDSEGFGNSTSSLPKIVRCESLQKWEFSQACVDLFTCEECGKAFKSMTTLRLHKLHHNTLPLSKGKKNAKPKKSVAAEILKEFPCSICPKSYARKDHFNQHMNIHSGLKPYKCPNCDKQFSTKLMKGNHFNKCHLGIDSIEKRQENRAEHIESEANPVIKHVGEQIQVQRNNFISIDKEFIGQKSSVKKRVKIKQMKDKQKKSEINICHEAIDLRNNIENQSLMTHKCNDCSKTFMKDKSLKVHIKKCQIRLKKQEEGLINAIENGDSTSQLQGKENPKYTCDECGKLFSSRKGLTKHLSLRICFQFDCLFCSEKFKVKEDLDWHVGVYHDLSDVD